MSQNCDSCGARLRSDAHVCDLCGTPTTLGHAEGVFAVTQSQKKGRGKSLAAGEGSTAKKDEPKRAARGSKSSPSTRSEGASEGRSTKTKTTSRPNCDECGQKNPARANYCNQCGTKLDEVSAGRSASAAPGDAAAPVVVEAKILSQSAVGKQIGIVVGASLLLVIALYVVTTLSTDSIEGVNVGPQVSGTPQTEELAAQWVPRQTELQDLIAESEGEETIFLRRQMIDLYFAAGRFDLAAEESEQIAESTGSEEEWANAGNLYFDWMQRVNETLRSAWARKAIVAYQRVLELNPSNLDVRTDMAIAYLYDPQNSMKAIQETTKVLEQDSLHIQANFNRGIMLSQINRNAQAIAQFQKVMRIVNDEQDPIYRRAEDAIRGISGLDNGGDSSSPSE